MCGVNVACKTLVWVTVVSERGPRRRVHRAKPKLWHGPRRGGGDRLSLAFCGRFGAIGALYVPERGPLCNVMPTEVLSRTLNHAAAPASVPACFFLFWPPPQTSGLK